MFKSKFQRTISRARWIRTTVEPANLSTAYQAEGIPLGKKERTNQPGGQPGGIPLGPRNLCPGFVRDLYPKLCSLIPLRRPVLSGLTSMRFLRPDTLSLRAELCRLSFDRSPILAGRTSWFKRPLLARADLHRPFSYGSRKKYLIDLIYPKVLRYREVEFRAVRRARSYVKELCHRCRRGIRRPLLCVTTAPDSPTYPAA